MRKGMVTYGGSAYLTVVLPGDLGESMGRLVPLELAHGC